ncbi:hypothetical protein HDE_02210 [Halotydeus destructor]|nr:hypothetical protein HDE_02210 [Halotydeus destructor]
MDDALEQPSHPKASAIDTAWSKKLITEDGTPLTIAAAPKMNLYIISDCDNLGPDWIRVLYKGGIYTTNYLLGSREDVICPIARHLAQKIIKPREDSQPDLPNNDPEQELLFSISLRNTSAEIVRLIASNL